MKGLYHIDREWSSFITLPIDHGNKRKIPHNNSNTFYATNAQNLKCMLGIILTK